MAKLFVNKQGNGGQIPSTHNRSPSVTKILSGEELGGRQCVKCEHKRSCPPTLGSMKKERITVWKTIALQK